MEVYLGIDVGTASTKGVAVTAAGDVVARAQRTHGVSTPHPGWFEQDPLSVWWSDACAVLADLLASESIQPKALAVSGIGPCLLPADADGSPLRPAILYGVDTRATDEIASLNALWGEREIAARGAILTSQAVGPKMLWVANHEPEVWARTRKIFMASSFLVHQLTGTYVLDHHSASQCSPLYDQRASSWDDGWWRELAGHVEAPPLRWSGDIVGTLTAEAATRTGLPVGLPVTAGTIDAWAEAESVLVREPGDMMVMYGSTMFLVAMTEQPLASTQLWPTMGIRHDVSCLAAGMATSGSVTSWLSSLTGTEYAVLTKEASIVRPGSEGLLLLPYFAGERSPLFDPRARGVVAGLTLAHGRGHLYRAALEGVAFGVRHNIEAMVSAGCAPSQLVPVGGGTIGDLWMQIVSDVTGLVQRVPRETIGAAYGDAMLAALATGDVSQPDTLRWNPVSREIEPDEQRSLLYDELYTNYRELYAETVTIVHRLAEIAGRRPV